MSRLVKFVTSLWIALSATITVPAHAAWGERDCSFGNAGTMTVPGQFGPLYGAVSEPDGNILARMGFFSTGGNLERINAAGTTSAHLGISSALFVWVPVDVVQPDGRILFSNGPQSPNPIGVGRFLAAGGIDASFSTDGYAAVPGLERVTSAPVLQPDGKILVGARVNALNVLLRFNADGTPDDTFGASGVAGSPDAHPDGYRSIELLADGKVVALAQGVLARHLPNGQLDPAFGTGGVAALPEFVSGNQVRVQPSGKILVAAGYPGNIRVYRFSSTGDLDTSVNGTGYREVSDGTGPLSVVWSPFVAMSMMPDGRPVMIGHRTETTGALVRYGVDLQDETTVPLDFAPTVAAILADGRLLLGGGNQAGRIRRLLGDSDPTTCITTTTSLTSSPNPSTFGQGIDLIATVTPSSAAPAQGTVQFKQGGVNFGSPVALVNGVATRGASNLAEGPTTFSAIFIPTGAYLESTSPPYVHTVTPRAPTTTSLTSSPNPSTSGQTVTLTATVAPQSGGGTPTGLVQFKDGFALLNTIGLSGGSATLNTSTLGDGTHSLTATYLGDSTFAPSTSSAVSHVVPGRVTVNDPTVNAGQAAATMTFAVTLTAASQSSVTVAYATSDRTAIAGTHYTATSGTLTFDPGQTSKTVPVPVAQGPVGPSKDFFLTLSNPVNASLAKGAAVGTITYIDTSTLAIFVADTAVIEGVSGVTLMGFNVSLSRPNSSTLSVTYATANGSAIAGTDYTTQSGTLAFPPGVTQRWVMVPILSNTTVDGNRTLFLNLSNPTQGVIGGGQGTGTIVDDDPTPAATSVPMFRLYSDVTKEHLYTTDGNEYAILGTRGWVQEGTAYTMFANPGTFGSQVAIPFYRMYHPGILQHHWTTDANEVMVLAAQGAWQYEGIAGYLVPSADTGSTPLYRLMYFNPPLHLWTTDLNEKDVLSTQYGWVYEGIVGEVLP